MVDNGKTQRMNAKNPIVICVLFVMLTFLIFYGNIKLSGRNDNSDGLWKNSLDLTDFTSLKTSDKLKSNYGLNKVNVTNQNLNIYQNWMVLVTVNSGFFDFFHNWLTSYLKINTVVPVTVIAEDDNVTKLINGINPGRITVERSDLVSVKAAVNYDSKDYTKLVATRPTHILKYLKKGINILYVDVDSVWLKDPFPYFVGPCDLWAQQDGDMKNICTGFLAFLSNNKTIDFVTKWEKSLHQYLEMDQPAFNKVRSNSSMLLCGLSMTEFPPGNHYFSKENNIDRSKVVVVHNNWIIGHDPKLQRFAEFKLWFV